MKTVAGPTDKVIVVGAGLGGLACAIHLAAAGREVTVLERSDMPGGRCGELREGGFRFDTGPTVLTMPELIDQTLSAVGERLADWVELVRLDPAYRAWFPDGSTLEVRAATADTAAEIARVCGPKEADGFLRFVDYVSRLYAISWEAFVDRNIDGPLDLVGPSLARLTASGGFGSLSRRIGSFFADPRTLRLFSFQALYAGMAPHRARALYALISYLDTVAGVYYPRGGMHTVAQAMAAVAIKHGVDIRYDHEVRAVELAGGRARGVRLSDGSRIAADVVVLNPDLPVAAARLLGRPLRRRLRYSPSCVLLHLGVTTGFPHTAHHNIVFGRAWRATFDDITRHGRTMRDPSLLVCNPSRTEPELAPQGAQSLYVLAPAPNLTADIDWRRTGPRYAEQLVGTLEERGYPGLSEAIEVQRIVTPSDWAAAGMGAGTPFALAHSVAQTGPWRPGNLAEGLENVVFVGSGTQPGVGVPMVLVSGRLAAQRITGHR